MRLADLLVEEGEVDEAINHYDETVRLFPRGERGHSRLAAALSAAGRLDEAIAQWGEAIRVAPEHWSSHLGLANTLLAAGDPAGAAAECNEILDHEPGAADAVVTLGMALLAQGNAEEAVFQLERAVRLDPRHPQAQFQLGLALNDAGRSQNALDHLNVAVRLQPDSVPILWNTAWILATCPDPLVRDGARAVDLAKKAVDLSKGQNLLALDALAAALAETGDFAAAVDVAWQASIAAVSQNQVELSDALAQRVRLYRQSLPYHEPPKAADQPGSPPDAAPAGAEQ